MAVKKTTKKEGSATPTKAVAKETAPKKKTTKPKAAAPKAPAAEPAAVTSVAEPTKPKVAPKKAAAAAIKLSPNQGELLKKIGGTADVGYSVEKKVEQRSIESLLEKKLIKKGAKDKASGTIRYYISSAGKKHTS